MNNNSNQPTPAIMQIGTGDGFDYTFDDFTKWAKQIGFSSTSLMPLAGPSSAAIAVK